MLSPPQVVGVVGRRNSGKSVFVRDLLFHMPRPELGVVMSFADDVCHYADLVAPNCVFDHFAPHALESVVAQGRDATVVIDDCFGDAGVSTCAALRRLFERDSKGERAHKISLVFAVAAALEVDAEFRSKVDFVVVMRESRHEWRRKVHRAFFTHLDFSQFDDAMQLCDDHDYKCLVLCKKTLGLSYYVSSVDLPSFRIGEKRGEGGKEGKKIASG